MKKTSLCLPLFSDSSERECKKPNLKGKTAFIISNVNHKQALKLEQMRKARMFSFKHFNKFTKIFSNYEHTVCILKNATIFML